MNKQAVKLVQQYKYFGTMITTKLCFELQVDVVCKNALQHIHFYRKRHSFIVDTTSMKMFY